MIVRILRFRPSIPLFDQVQDHSSVPAKACKADARRGGPGRPKGRREAALPGTGASAPARLHLSEMSLCAAVLLFVALTETNAAALAETRPADPTASYRTGNSFADFVEAASRRFGIPVGWILAVIDVESAGEVRAKSPRGAMGLMQIMPETWAELRLRYELGNDPYDPHDNLLAGTAYLRELRDRYGAPGLFAAYNAGPARYDERLAGRPLPVETEAYLRKLAPVIGSDLTTSSAVARLRSSAGALFVVRPESPMSAARRPLKRAPTIASVHDISAIVPRTAGLFVARSDAGGSQ
ncbi:soluble lytic murein transglycosylase-like protein [Bradyrhizobium sp. JR7.2]|uniref:lytic transglycosylase domain-containing protein n=1 Tax=Bradyrhizobium TaxID=374 RepID=UPI0024AEEDA3|nr:lytic transglycosylase domain-containing protein [Bradyrhizobium barranii]WFT92946.1 lytic transglycosylase domain-containing protein [Bradyrhizobium barranii]